MIDSSLSRTPVLGQPALVPVPSRLPVVLGAVLAAAVVVWLGGLLADTSVPSAVDATVAAGLAQGTWSDVVTTLGEPGTVVAVAGLVAIASLWRGRNVRLAALAVLGPGLTGVVTTVAKPLVGRRLPDGSLSFPSGHTAGVTGICLLLGFALVAAYGARRGMLLAIGAATVVAAGLVGAGMVAEHAHYATDVLGGFCAAVAATAVAALAIDALAARVLAAATSARPTGG